MQKSLLTIAFTLFSLSLAAMTPYPWTPLYHALVMQRFAERIPCLAACSYFHYPNTGYETLFTDSLPKKILIFGYGSLMNKESILRINKTGKPTVKMEAVNSMRPAVAFGVKRIYNYKYKEKRCWRFNLLHPNEKALLNLMPATNPSSTVNGVVMEVDEEDLQSLIARERGYDLIPVLVAPWDQLVAEEKNIVFIVAYAFMASCELRNHVAYTSNQFLPIKPYMEMVAHGAAAFGPLFLQMMQKTTYLGDGTTLICDWDGSWFISIAN